MMLRALAVSALALLVAAPAGAVERASAQASRERQTSSLEQVSVKPLMQFSMRGRLDPFMAYALLTTTASTAYFSAANLVFTGLVQVQGSPVALFKDNAGQAYTLKSAKLHGPDNQPVNGVRGRISSDGDVLLQQGEKRYMYSAKRMSKRLENAPSR